MVNKATTKITKTDIDTVFNLAITKTDRESFNNKNFKGREFYATESLNKIKSLFNILKVYVKKDEQKICSMNYINYFDMFRKNISFINSSKEDKRILTIIINNGSIIKLYNICKDIVLDFNNSSIIMLPNDYNLLKDIGNFILPNFDITPQNKATIEDCIIKINKCYIYCIESIWNNELFIHLTKQNVKQIINKFNSIGKHDLVDSMNSVMKKNNIIVSINNVFELIYQLKFKFAILEQSYVYKTYTYISNTNEFIDRTEKSINDYSYINNINDLAELTEKVEDVKNSLANNKEMFDSIDNDLKNYLESSLEKMNVNKIK